MHLCHQPDHRGAHGYGRFALYCGEQSLFRDNGSERQFVYVANLFDNNISGYTIDPTTGALTAIAGSPFAGGTRPISIAFRRAKPSVRAVYITNEGSNNVSVINPSTDTVVSTVTVGPNPVDAVLTPNGATAYITNAGADTVSVINTITNRLGHGNSGLAPGRCGCHSRRQQRLCSERRVWQCLGDQHCDQYGGGDDTSWG
jgi:YVTN family beta-propeller protein